MDEEKKNETIRKVMVAVAILGIIALIAFLVVISLPPPA